MKRPHGSTSRPARGRAGVGASSSCRCCRRSTPAAKPPSWKRSMRSRSGEQAKMPLPPVMIYGDDVSHVVTEEGVAYLYKATSLEERRDALAAVAKATPIGSRVEPKKTERLRRDGLVAYPEDLGVDPTLAESQPAGRAQHRRSRHVVGRSLRPAGEVPGLVMPATAEHAAGVPSFAPESPRCRRACMRAAGPRAAGGRRPARRGVADSEARVG